MDREDFVTAAKVLLAIFAPVILIALVIYIYPISDIGAVIVGFVGAVIILMMYIDFATGGGPGPEYRDSESYTP